MDNSNELEQWLIEDFPSDIDTDIELSDDESQCINIGKWLYEIVLNNYFNYTNIFLLVNSSLNDFTVLNESHKKQSDFCKNF